MTDPYREDLMEIYKNPANKGTISDPSVEVIEVNQKCGDKVNLQLLIKDNVIVDAKFMGEQCAVSLIATEVLIEEILHKNISEVKNLDKEKLLDLLNLNLSTSRVSCAMLPLEALKQAITTYETTHTNNSQQLESVEKDATEKYIATPDTNIAELVWKYPDTAEVLNDYGLHCAGCFASGMDTVSAGAKIHGLSDDEVKEMLARINEVIEYGD